MKKLFTSLALVTVLGSSQVIASNVDDGFNWPGGLSTDNTASQQLQVDRHRANANHLAA